MAFAEGLLVILLTIVLKFFCNTYIYSKMKITVLDHTNESYILIKMKHIFFIFATILSLTHSFWQLCANHQAVVVFIIQTEFNQ